MEEKLIIKTFDKYGDDLVYNEYFAIGNEKLHIYIRGQMENYIEILSPDRHWNWVYEIPSSLSKTPSALVANLDSDTLPSSEFEKYVLDDVAELKRVAKELLNLN